MTALTLFKDRLNVKVQLTFSLEEAVALRGADALLVPLSDSLAGYVLDVKEMQDAGPTRKGFAMLYRDVVNLSHHGLTREKFWRLEPGNLYFLEEL